MKYKMKSTPLNYPSEFPDKYKIKVKDGSDNLKVTVRNFSMGLNTWYYGKECCVIKDDGNKFNVDIEGKKFILEYDEQEYLLAALLAWNEYKNYQIDFKEK